MVTTCSSWKVLECRWRPRRCCRASPLRHWPSPADASVFIWSASHWTEEEEGLNQSSAPTWLTTSTAAPSLRQNQTSLPPPPHRPPQRLHTSSRSSRGPPSSSSSSSSSSWACWSSAVSESSWTRIEACRPPPGRTTWRRTPSTTEFPDRQPERQQPWQPTC